VSSTGLKRFEPTRTRLVSSIIGIRQTRNFATVSLVVGWGSVQIYGRALSDEKGVERG